MSGAITFLAIEQDWGTSETGVYQLKEVPRAELKALAAFLNTVADVPFDCDLRIGVLHVRVSVTEALSKAEGV